MTCMFTSRLYIADIYANLRLSAVRVFSRQRNDSRRLLSRHGYQVHYHDVFVEALMVRVEACALLFSLLSNKDVTLATFVIEIG